MHIFLRALLAVFLYMGMLQAYDHYGIMVNKNGAPAFDFTDRYANSYHYAVQERLSGGLCTGLIAFGFLSPQLKQLLDEQLLAIQAVCADASMLNEQVVNAFAKKGSFAMAAIAKVIRDFQGYSVADMFAHMQPPRRAVQKEKRLIAQVSPDLSHADRKQPRIVVQILEATPCTMHDKLMYVSLPVCVY